MSYRLRMSAELSDWLAGLCASQPGSPEAVTAAETGAALTAVLDAADPAQLALVTDLGLAGPADSGDPLAAVDDAAQSVRSGLEVLRAQVASAAEEDASRERELRDRLRSGEIAAETLRIRAAAAAGRYTASAAGRDIQLAIITVPGQRSGETAAAKAGLADAQDELTAAGTELAAIVASARALRRSLLRGAGGTRAAGTGDPDGAAAGLLELQADPFGTEIRILLAIEPADTVTCSPSWRGRSRSSSTGLAPSSWPGSCWTSCATTAGGPATPRALRWHSPMWPRSWNDSFLALKARCSAGQPCWQRQAPSPACAVGAGSASPTWPTGLA